MAVTYNNSKSELYRMESDEENGKSSRKVTILTVISVILFFACAGLVAALIVIILEDDKKESPVNGDSKYCLTSHCAMMAGAMAERMKPEIDPCTDFSEFACGNWVKRTVIPEDRSTFTTFSELRNDLDIKLKALVEEPVLESDIKPIENVKNNYIACTDIEKIESRGGKPLTDLMTQLGGWPVLENKEGGNWNSGSFDLVAQLSKLRGEYGNTMIYNTYVGTDNKDSTRYILKLDQPGLGLPSREYYLEDGRDNKYLTAYHKYMTTIATMLGADESTAERDFTDLIDFEIKIANLTTPADQRRDNNALYNKMTIADLQQNVTGFEWLRFYKGLRASWCDSLKDSEDIVVYEPGYVKDVTVLVEQTPNRTLANYLIWSITMGRISQLSSAFRDVELEYDEVIYGTASESARWQSCVGHVNGVMAFATGRMFVDEYFDEESKTRTNDMIDYLEDAFLEMVDESKWMDAPTQEVAKEKAAGMTRKIGYPDWIKKDDELNEYYKNYDFDPTKYFENYLDNLKEGTQRSFEKLRTDVDKLAWSSGPAIVNAFYSSSSNSITFPAGILQPLFYHKDSPEYLNFGGIGMVIGHEITHGFDDRGRQYDKDGNLQQWWSDESISAYTERANCIVNQYGNYYMSECNMTLNGVQTQGENIADNGGMKETYRGYRQWVADNLEGEELRLPGIDLTQDQMLFVNFAQIWCSKYTEQGARNRILTGVHSPGQYRVIGPISNLPEFADVFECPEKSPMNPVDKCTVW
ncbi:membrane metallo-endopeptidase-like 1 [Glandiceps talaboti]